VARDSLPYTEEFARLKDGFFSRSFRQLSDQEFWTALVGVAKKGGVRGKPKGEPGPDLTEEQRIALLRLLPVPIGERDRLPYSDSFARFVERFNKAMSLQLTPREVWQAILRSAK
jgi:hypothetical protein